jgi:Tfp pilus assembly protein PilO
MKKWKSTKPIVAILCALTLALMVVALSIYRSGAQRTSTLKAELQAKKHELAGLRKRLATRPALERRYRLLRARLDRLETGLPTGAYVPTFLKQIESLAWKTGNQIAGIKPVINLAQPQPQSQQQQQQKKQSGSSPYERMSIEMQLQGRYWTMVSFLDQLDRFPKMIAVNDISLSPSGGQKKSIISSRLQLTALIYQG